jgi:transcriptional regulator with XRE-family HTH domain
MIEPAQIRAARARLGWRQEDLSKASGVGTATVRRIESANSSATSYVSTLSRIKQHSKPLVFFSSATTEP